MLIIPINVTLGRSFRHTRPKSLQKAKSAWKKAITKVPILIFNSYDKYDKPNRKPFLRKIKHKNKCLQMLINMINFFEPVMGLSKKKLKRNKYKQQKLVVPSLLNLRLAKYKDFN